MSLASRGSAHPCFGPACGHADRQECLQALHQEMVDFERDLAYAREDTHALMWMSQQAQHPCVAAHNGESISMALAKLLWSRLRTPAVCVWRYMDWPESESDFDTECGQGWCFNEGDVKQNGVHFCPHCGGRVVLSAPPEDEADEDDEGTT